MSGQDLFSNFLMADLSPKGATKTNLSNTILFGAILNGADLTYANLDGANLMSADLGGADLYGANLSGAFLNGVGLGRANLTGTIWKETPCPDGTMNNGTSPCTPEQLNLA